MSHRASQRASVRRSRRFAAFVVGLCASAQMAAAADVSQLDKLTPSGATKEGNSDGSIPAWEGAVAPLPGYEWGKLRRDHWKYKDDKPLFSIDAASVDKYADKLSPGQVAMLKQTKGYRMDVYPSRRTCGVPDFVAANTRKNVGTAKLAADGWSLKEATVPGYPVPHPVQGRGGDVELQDALPRRGHRLQEDDHGGVAAARQRRMDPCRLRADAVHPDRCQGLECAVVLPAGRVLRLLRLQRAGGTGGAGTGDHAVPGPGRERDLLLLPGPAPRAPHADVLARLAADRHGEPVHAGRAERLQRRARPLRLEAGGQEGDDRAVQRLRRPRLQGQVRGRGRQRLHRPEPPPLRDAPRVGHRGHASRPACATPRRSGPSTSTRTAGRR